MDPNKLYYWRLNDHNQLYPRDLDIFNFSGDDALASMGFMLCKIFTDRTDVLGPDMIKIRLVGCEASYTRDYVHDHKRFRGVKKTRFITHKDCLQELE